DVAWKDLGLLRLDDESGQFVAAQSPDGIANRFVLGGETEVKSHGGESCILHSESCSRSGILAYNRRQASNAVPGFARFRTDPSAWEYTDGVEDRPIDVWRTTADALRNAAPRMARRRGD